MMMRGKPQIYANCPAGCKWETVHKSDFVSLSHNIGTSDWSGTAAPYTHSLTIDGLVDEDLVVVDAPFTAYSEYGLIVEQTGSTITFSVTIKPAENIEIKIAVIPSTAVVEI